MAGGGEKGKGTLVDQVASKGIWQAGASPPPPHTYAYICRYISINNTHLYTGELPSEATEALERVGWIDRQGNGAEASLSPAPMFSREDIAYMVEQVLLR